MAGKPGPAWVPPGARQRSAVPGKGKGHATLHGRGREGVNSGSTVWEDREGRLAGLYSCRVLAFCTPCCDFIISFSSQIFRGNRQGRECMHKTPSCTHTLSHLPAIRASAASSNCLSTRTGKPVAQSLLGSVGDVFRGLSHSCEKLCSSTQK